MDIEKVKDYFKRLSDDDLLNCLCAVKREYNHRSDIRKEEAVKDFVKAYNKLRMLFCEDDNIACVRFKNEYSQEEIEIDFGEWDELTNNSVIWR